MSATLCLGEAIVDLIEDRSCAAAGAGDRFTAHFGGATANVAVFAARAGARAALTGIAGADRWGRWLRARLRDEGVDVTGFALRDDVSTQLAFVTVDARGEPAYVLHGAPRDAVGAVAEGAVDDAAALFISSNTLSGEGERAATMAARGRALSAGRPVVFDCNLRLHRWPSAAEAAASARACVPGAVLVRASREEASLLTGVSDPARAAEALLGLGASAAVIGLGSDGALLRGAGGARVTVPAPAVRVVSTIGAGDALTGALLAALARAGFDPAAVADALPGAVAAASAVCERWGALQ